MNKDNNKGFTLAEMLIVVAIIGVLISIVSFAITNFLEKSREAVDLATIKSAQEELYAYAISYEDNIKNRPSYMFYYKNTTTNKIEYYGICVKMT